MAARRLILVLVMLLVISSIMAQLARPPTTQDGTGASTTTDPTTTSVGDKPMGGELLRRRVGPASASSSGPTEIRATVGDQLQLQVSVAQPGTVAIPARGLIEPAEPAAPARFDLLLREPGRLEVHGPDGRTVAAIVTGPTRRDAG